MDKVDDGLVEREHRALKETIDSPTYGSTRKGTMKPGDGARVVDYSLIPVPGSFKCVIDEDY